MHLEPGLRSAPFGPARTAADGEASRLQHVLQEEVPHRVREPGYRQRRRASGATALLSACDVHSCSRSLRDSELRLSRSQLTKATCPTSRVTGYLLTRIVVKSLQTGHGMSDLLMKHL